MAAAGWFARRGDVALDYYRNERAWGRGQRRGSAAAAPTGRPTAPEEVAKLVAKLIAYLASEAARQIPGAAIPIDAGNTAG